MQSVLKKRLADGIFPLPRFSAEIGTKSTSFESGRIGLVKSLSPDTHSVSRTSTAAP